MKNCAAVLTDEFLRQAYLKDKLSTVAIARATGFSISSVNYHMKKNGVLARPPSYHNAGDDIIDRQFGCWTVIAKDKKTSRTGGSFWLCRCVCGRKKVVQRTRLVTTNPKKCSKCRGISSRSTEIVKQAYWSQVKRGAKKRGFQFVVTREEAKELLIKQGFKCALSGLEISFAERVADHWHGKSTASLDRIDSFLGYTLSNIQWLHKDVNKMKSNLSSDRFSELCRLIAMKLS